MLAREMCCVYGCTDLKSPRFHFPSPRTQPERFNAWVKATGNANLLKIKPSTIQASYRVCARHFQCSDQTPISKSLVKTSIPTLFLPEWNNKTIIKKLPKRVVILKRPEQPVNLLSDNDLIQPKNVCHSLPGIEDPLSLNTPELITKTQSYNVEVQTNDLETLSPQVFSLSNLLEANEAQTEPELYEKNKLNTTDQLPIDGSRLDSLQAQYWKEKNEREKEMHDFVMKKEGELYKVQIESWRLNNKRKRLKIELLQNKVKRKNNNNGAVTSSTQNQAKVKIEHNYSSFINNLT